VSPPILEAPRERSFEEDPMIAMPPIARRRIEVGEAHGLHLRPATRFVEVAKRYAAEVRVHCNGAEADGKSILDLLSLAAGFGTVLELEARGPDAEEAVAALADLISARPHQIEECRVA
jgi:phosphocarrier protein HPr